ncbi:MAG: FAD-dependent oxidoreductase [Vicinamibacteria bacterium]|nr:FAD-dependent oxidoreductase [Vicinamibacteria bacterium]
MRVVVIGAGFAGMAAAIRLQEQGHAVTLIERLGALGGRATSYRDVVTGDEVDNGTHLLVGACSEALALLRRTGAKDLLWSQDRLSLDFVDHRGFTTLDCPRLMAPLHLVFGILGLRMPWSARLSALRLGWAIRARPPRERLTLASYLARSGQSSTTRRLLWDPLATAILNEDPERADARLFGRVFTETFLRRARASALVFARRGWGTIANRLGMHFEAHGGVLIREFHVTSVDVKDDHVVGVHGRTRERNEAENGRLMARSVAIPADAVIAAVPWRALPSFLPQESARRPPFENLRLLSSSPIVSLDLWLDRRVVPRPMIGFRNSELQWVFDKGLLHGRSGPPQHLSFVVSAAYRDLARKNAEIVRLAEETLRRYFPEMVGARVVRSLVMRDPHATFSCSPEAEAFRPGPVTPIRGLLLAGDWTNTELPATIESAVRSGIRAADRIEHA